MQKAFWVAGSTQSKIVNWPDDLAARMWIAFAIGILFVWISQRIFSRLQGNFAQEL
jgi:ABC-2 type transport system permease protein